MAEVSYVESVLINADPERVFDYRLDFGHLGEYNPNVSELRRVADGAGDGVGAEYVFNLNLPGAPEPIESPLRVTKADRPNSLTYDTGPGWMATGANTFEPKDGGTLVSLEYTLSFPGEIDDATRAAMVEAGAGEARTELENMKKILESAP